MWRSIDDVESTDDVARLEEIEAQMRIAIESARKVCGRRSLAVSPEIAIIAGEIFQALRSPPS